MQRQEGSQGGSHLEATGRKCPQEEGGMAVDREHKVRTRTVHLVLTHGGLW